MKSFILFVDKNNNKKQEIYHTSKLISARLESSNIVVVTMFHGDSCIEYRFKTQRENFSLKIFMSKIFNVREHTVEIRYDSSKKIVVDDSFSTYREICSQFFS